MTGIKSPTQMVRNVAKYVEIILKCGNMFLIFRNFVNRIYSEKPFNCSTRGIQRGYVCFRAEHVIVGRNQRKERVQKYSQCMVWILLMLDMVSCLLP